MRDYIEIPPIKEEKSYFDVIELRIKRAFKKYFYLPLLKELQLPKKLLNAGVSPLEDALASGVITYSRGAFRGKFEAETSKQIRKLGAKWDSKTLSYKISKDALPVEVRSAISISAVRFEEKLQKIDKKLSEISPVEITSKIRTADVFDSTLFKVDRKVQSSLKGISVSPKLTDGERKKIADEWQTNMDLWIQNFTEEEIISLRKDVEKSFFSGNRYEALVKSIEDSFNVTANKAKFLARQETALLMAKFKETRYTKSGVEEYKWGCVAGSSNHPVRPSHKILEGKIFSWNNPPITTASNEPARRNNPGQDYNCRCFAKPIVRVK